MNLPAIKFTEAEQIAAYQNWGANCGPNALAVVAGLSLEDVHRHLIGFDLKRYVNPTMMEGGLVSLELPWTRDRGLIERSGPTEGLARVQWMGKWLNPGVPKIVSYRHTHWIACFHNHVFCTASRYYGWIPIKDYQVYLDEKFCPQNGYPGWHITHWYSIRRES